MSSTSPRPVRDAVEQAEDRRLRREARRRWNVFGVTAVAIFGADQVAKLIVRGAMDHGDRIAIIPGFGLVRARNEGIAFGLFPGNQTLVAVLTVVALGLIATVLARLAARSPAVAFGGGLLLGGSVGNFVDRLVHGGVTDFLDPVAFPAFNVADVGIVVGAAIVALGLLRVRDSHDRK
jgi:signal peptidase II